MLTKRAVITGMGAITPLGNSLSDFWTNSIKGVSGAKKIDSFDVSSFSTRFACLVKDYDPSQWLDHKEIRTTDLFCQYALSATDEAIKDSGLDLNALNPYDIGVIFGSGQGGMATFEKEVSAYSKRETKRYSPYFVPKIITNMASGLVAIKYGIMGICYTTVSACATGNTSLMNALNYIRLGKAKVIISGGAEAPVTPASLGGFGSMRALSTQNEDPSTASKPFDTNRNGFVMGEGAGALIVEEYEHAKKRGARIYAELAGASMTADAYHMTATHPEGKGAVAAMQAALLDAGIKSEAVDYINAHATATALGDLSEARAIYHVFRSNKKAVINATKSMTGHLLGATASIEAILCILAINHGIVPPTINTKNIDPKLPKGLKIITKHSLEKQINVAVSNAFGFGGHNSTVLFKRM
ncbi:MAG: beta-ketoacyl-ACP synthase II [Bacteroidota bacterium]